ncbi:hypothetical protein TREMEDRAFT_43510 [Tremella mesenterica DSM 1558]|uniref:uncharacterized protein n=1 Tax=Tremella mesenterica (strain ATCC 24925 / CBS 8224 / DSM 1558 / NBRC 9311 / NRRL Y-6157 / RJB 2259-6 / UBC 559-6) TaxID=578456 RepID=UPI0003F49B04|nr:uncharacterized protein TREMEDRAFT_43510 [Tremella mesenterica DSM 1558]EIW69835.1 hypothetical protein TREMEDRAFT_43510 [Tremella mesenterica DSM 1558]
MTAQPLPNPSQPLPSPIRLLVSLSALCSTLHPPHPPAAGSESWHSTHSASWLQSVLKSLEIQSSQLPPTVTPDSVHSVSDQCSDWSAEEKQRVAGILVEASLAVEADSAKAQKEESLRYTPLARALNHLTLTRLGLEGGKLLSKAEKNLCTTLFNALKAAEEEKAQKEKVEQVRQARSQGWGGSLGRHLATGAGVIAGGVLIGVTGGLAAPAIASLLAPLGIGSLLGGAAAPVVLGTLFGVGGGGLAGRRVRERWKGVEEFSFVEIGDGTKVTKEEMDDLNETKEKAKQRAARKKEESKDSIVKVTKDKTITGHTSRIPDPVQEENKDDHATAEQAVEEGRQKLEDRLLRLSLNSASSPKPDATRTSTESIRPSLDHPVEEKTLTQVKKPPSLTAIIVVPGLLTVSRTEAITAWRAVCSSESGAMQMYDAREKPTENMPISIGEGKQATGTIAEKTREDVRIEAGGDLREKGKSDTLAGLKDGRDVYLLRYETSTMLKTGRDIDLWIVESKLKAKIKSEIIKRTVLNAYFAAVSLPLTVYSMATMSLDNTWMHAVDRARKAGTLLGEVLEKRVQGQRPVILIGSSLGALTVQTALLHLASLSHPTGSNGIVPNYVESAFLISLPSAPTAEEWAKCRGVTARRLVNAWSESDLVLAGVVRLHEVLSRATTLSSGIKVAGLGPVNQPGVEDVNLSGVLGGHMELQAKIGDVLRVIDPDA